MLITPTSIAGAMLVAVAPNADERGLFARTYDEASFIQAGLPTHWPQCNASWNRVRGTLRGMHYQAAHAPEPKLVRCTHGRILDVIVDMRPASATFKRWTSVELSAASRNALYVPPGIAHGFLTLEDGAEVFYHMGANFVPDAARGVRWNDPAFAIAWPYPPVVISRRDAGYLDFAG